MIYGESRIVIIGENIMKILDYILFCLLLLFSLKHIIIDRDYTSGACTLCLWLLYISVNLDDRVS